MENKTKFTSESLLNIKFKAKDRGYDPEHVDQVFDEIILDYKLYERLVEKNDELVAEQKEDINSLKKMNHNLELEVAKLKKQLEAISFNTKINQDNYQLYKKVNIYERFLYKKGYNPEKIYSDPDNC